MKEAKRAFEAYRTEVGGLAYDGTVIPEWQDLRPHIKAGWEAAAKASFTMRSRYEIERRYEGLLKLFVESDKTTDESVYLYQRLDTLLWVLHPSEDDHAGNRELLTSILFEEKRVHEQSNIDTGVEGTAGEGRRSDLYSNCGCAGCGGSCGAAKATDADELGPALNCAGSHA